VKESKPISVLLDNSAVNHLVGEDECSPSEMFAHLLQYQNAGRIKVMATPTNILEIYLCSSKPDKRLAMARNLNELVGGKRVLPDFEFETLSNLVALLRRHIPTGVVDETIPEALGKRGALPFLALLAELALIEDFEGGFPGDIVRAKLGTLLSQLMIMAEPDVFIPQLIRQARGEPVDDGVRARLKEVDNLSLPVLEGKIAELKKTTVRSSNLNTWLKNREETVRLYTSAITTEAVVKCFDFPADLHYLLKLFDFWEIVAHWEEKFLGEVYTPLSQELKAAFQEGAETPHPAYYLELISRLCDRYSGGLMTASYYSVLGFFKELERNIRRPKTISDGLTLDMNYLAVLPRVDWFISFDSFQANAAEEYAASLVGEDGTTRPTLRVFRSQGEVLAAFTEKQPASSFGSGSLTKGTSS